MKLNSDNYTEETWNALNNKLEIANKVLVNENPTEEEITKAYNELPLLILRRQSASALFCV